MTLSRVLKRDGRNVPFERAKIQEAVSRAQTAVDDRDERLAEEVAELVALALERRYRSPRVDGQRDCPDIEEIQDLVERALIELGAAAVAKAYILHRDRRARVRESLAVGAEVEPRGGRPPRVRESESIAEWSKGRIVAALMNEAELVRPVAEDVAARVERRVFASGLKRLSTSLVRALVDNELVELGLERALKRQGSIGLPRHDLRRLLRTSETGTPGGTAPAPGERLGDRSLVGRVGREVLRRFAFEDVFTEEVSDRHLSGELSIEDLSQPHLYLAQAVPAELCLRGEPSPAAAFELLDELSGFSACVSRTLVLEQPSPALLPLTRATRSGTGLLPSWLVGLSSLARAAGIEVELSGFGERQAALISKLVLAVAEVRDGSSGAVPRVVLSRAEAEAAMGHDPSCALPLERLLDAGCVLPGWSTSEERLVGRGLARRPRERGGLALGGTVALNLARAARKAGPWREDAMLQELSDLVGAALDALHQLAGFQRDERAARSGEVRGRVGYALVPVGLREALAILGDGEVRPEQGARLLGVLGEVARRRAAERRLSVGLTESYAGRAGERFARLDGEQFKLNQGLLFPAAGAGELRERRPYESGWRLGLPESSPLSEKAPGALEGTLLSTVPFGVLTHLAEGARAALPAARGEPPVLTAWQRFERTRAARLTLGRSGFQRPSVPPAARPLFDDEELEEIEASSLNTGAQQATLPPSHA